MWWSPIGRSHAMRPVSSPSDMKLTNWILDRSTVRPQRSGGVHTILPVGAASMVLTPDSNQGGSGHLNWRAIRDAAPHWLAPAIVGRIYNAATWQLDISYGGPDGGAGLEGSWSETWAAGTDQSVLIASGRTVETSNEPGWESISDALAGRRHPKPPPDEDEFAAVAGFGLFTWSFAKTTDGIAGLLQVTANLAAVRPAWYAASAPALSSPNRWPDFEGLEPCWWVNFGFSAQAYVDGSLVSSTSLGTFEGRESGTISGSDSDWSLELSIAASQTVL